MVRFPRTTDADGLFTSIAFTHFELPAGTDGIYAVTGIAFRDTYHYIRVVNAKGNCVLASMPTFTFLGYEVTKTPAPTAAPKLRETAVPAVCQTAAPTETALPAEAALPTETAARPETGPPTQCTEPVPGEPEPTWWATPTMSTLPSESATRSAAPGFPSA